MAASQLQNEFRKLCKEPWTHIELADENLFEWMVALIVLNPDSQYYGGYFKAKMTFPKDYPYSPPDFRFLKPLWHPNVYPDGRLCISILHPPGDDEMSGEVAAERWTPVQSAESVLLSILSLLDDAEVGSAANVDAGVQLRKDPEAYRRRVKEDLDKSKNDIPTDFVMPTHQDAFKTKKDDDIYMTWDDSDEEEDFGGSDSDMEEADWDDDDAAAESTDQEEDTEHGADEA